MANDMFVHMLFHPSLQWACRKVRSLESEGYLTSEYGVEISPGTWSWKLSHQNGNQILVTVNTHFGHIRKNGKVVHTEHF